MNDHARENILGRLRNALEKGELPLPEVAPLSAPSLNQAAKVEQLKRLMEAVHTEVHVVAADDWVANLKALVKQRQFNSLVYGPETPLGKALETAWEQDLPALTPYTEDIENFKEQLFACDASITSTKGGIAESGALILWPDKKEPRLMSLVPTVHIAVLEAETIYNSLGEAMAEGQWQNGMPTNALLISGPSKTADIELTLTFGVHGPKELIVFVLMR